jgi:protein-S-isoprenylcysteine O-methyltransferase Ste14
MKIDPLTLAGYCWFGIGLFWLAGLAFTKRVARRMPASARLFQIAVGLLGVTLMTGRWFDQGWMAHLFLPDTPGALQFAAWTGLALTFVGCLFACWARITLGGNWSGEATVKHNHELIVSGPYALTRHPIYTGLLTAAIGTTLIIARWHSVVGLVVVVLMLILKMSQEERMMTQQFPESYASYRRRVRALIPGLL